MSPPMPSQSFRDGGVGFGTRFFYWSTSIPPNLDIDLSNKENNRITTNINEGFENSIWFWEIGNVNLMDDIAVESLIHVLDFEHTDLWKWLTAQEQPPEAVSSNPLIGARILRQFSVNERYSEDTLEKIGINFPVVERFGLWGDRQAHEESLMIPYYFLGCERFLGISTHREHEENQTKFKLLKPN
ncbi:unnamed protein product [Microthlaspi erraticum]|uniref:Uncharacterized protein n=1 Tax=Microthlaspi erraticum TaxID=1685480 RepID=A0A6D2JSZ5_9BRAS|nr:unnamed protein product [Microthlaspi erraticum]